MKKNVWLLSLSVMLLILPAQVWASHPEGKSAQLSVRGNAILSVPADRLNFSVGVAAAAREVDDAMNVANRRLNDIMKALEKAGLNKKEIKTRRFDIQPQWSSRPKNAERDWRPEIVGFSASTSLSIQTLKLDLGGKLLAAAAKAGANTIGSLYFDLAEPQKYRDRAIRAATANALADARSLAEASGVEIVRITSLDLDQARPAPVRMDAESGMVMKAMAGPEPPPIVAGDVSVQASVKLVCEITGQKPN